MFRLPHRLAGHLALFLAPAVALVADSLVPPPPPHLDVEVVDAEGLPVSGAEIHLSCADASCEQVCTTATDGSCRLLAVPNDEDLWLWVGHREHERTSTEIDGGTRSGRVLVMLPAPPWKFGRTEGRVLDDRGEPVAGALVSLIEMLEHVPDEWTAATDVDGRFSVERIPEGSYFAEVAVDGFAPVAVGHWVGAGAPPLEIGLQRGATIRGSIVEPPARICDDAVVRATQVFERNDFQLAMPFRGPGAKSFASGLDARGSFTVENVPPGHYRVYLDNRSCDRARWETLVEVRPEDRELRADLELVVYDQTPRPPVAGVVRDAATGEGLPGVRVLVVHRTETSVGWTGEPETTDAEGRFAFPFSAPSAEVMASRSGYTTVYAPWDGSAGSVDIELQPTSGLRYRIGWSDGGEPGMVELTLTDAAGRLIRHPNAESNGHWADAPEGDFLLRIEHPFAAAELPIEIPGPRIEIELPAGGATRLRIPELEAEFGDGWLEGTVVEARPLGELDAPVARARETVEVEALVPGTWSITLTAPDGRSWSGRVEIRERVWATTYLR